MMQMAAMDQYNKANPPSAAIEGPGRPTSGSGGGSGISQQIPFARDKAKIPVDPIEAIAAKRSIYNRDPSIDEIAAKAQIMTPEMAAYRVGIADAQNRQGVLGTERAAGYVILQKGTPEVMAAYRKGIEAGLK
jgi:hypothetical protein